MFGNLIMLCFGLFCLGNGVKIILNSKKTVDDGKRKVVECTGIVRAKVVDVERVTSSINLKIDKPKFHFVYEYEVGGSTYRESSTYGYTLEAEVEEDPIKERNMGREVDIHYNPQDPSDFYIPFEQDISSGPVATIAAGAFIVIIGLMITISSMLSIMARRK